MAFDNDRIGFFFLHETDLRENKLNQRIHKRAEKVGSRHCLKDVLKVIFQLVFFTFASLFKRHSG